MNRILVITGPTCTGKSDMAIKLAELLDTEIVSADSMQIYKYMDIGTAKPDANQLAQVPHHMINVADPTESFSVVKYQEMAREAVDSILSQRRIPIIAGGTGLYINSIIYDMDFAAPPSDDGLRRELENTDTDTLYEILCSVDPESAKRIHKNNRKKVIRAIESAKNGRNINDFSESFHINDKYSPLMMCLNMDREKLYERINGRVDKMFASGLVDEVKKLMAMGLTYDDISMKGIGYKEVILYLQGDISLEDAVAEVKKNTRHYAKRQMTWFKQYRDMKTFDVTFNDRYEDILIWLTKEL